MAKKFGKSERYVDFQNNRRISNDYTEHPNPNRRVSFKQHSRPGKKNKGKNWDHAIKSYLDDEDIDMGGIQTAGSSHGRIHHGKKRGGHRMHSPIPRGNFNNDNRPKKRLLEGPTSWYKVTLRSVSNYDKQYLLKVLVGHIAQENFIPINELSSSFLEDIVNDDSIKDPDYQPESSEWRNEGYDSTFYIDDFKIASKIFNIDRKVVLPDGHKLNIRVFHGTPVPVINDAFKEKVKLAMASRYNPQTKALDLSKFHLDPQLQDVFCALSRAVIMTAAVDVIAENIPELEALNLADNRLYAAEHLCCLKKKLHMLKILYLSNNKLRDIRSLDHLKGLNLVELVLDGNPLCDKFKDQAVYVSEVRKRFPKVIKLDGVDLPPPILFDVVEECKLPTSVQTFLCNEAGGDIVRTFLEQYFLIYDSGNRQPLLQAYHENAMYSMTMAYPWGQSQKNSPPLNWYQSDSRNLFRVQDIDRRHKLLRQGQLAIVSYLAEIPKTQHDMNSFKVDLSFFTPQFLMLNVAGVFKEIGGGFKTPPIRAFNRALIIVAANSGFCIINEMVHITNATEAQEKVAFTSPIPLPVSTEPISSPSTSVVTTPPQVPVQPEPDDITKQQMVHTLSQQTAMNIEYSTKCLQETTWDFQRAILIFTELQKQGRIPAEAFIK